MQINRHVPGSSPGAWCFLDLRGILAGIAAGALRLPVGRFLLDCTCGRTIRIVLLAYADAGLLPCLLIG